MRSLVMWLAPCLLAAPPGLQAAEARVGTCESTVGAWELVGSPGGRGLMTREGAKYEVLWVFRVANASTGAPEGAGQAGECTCRPTADRLAWNCLVVFSLQAAETGAEQTFEWEPDGDAWKVWHVGPDGKRTAGGAVRRPK